MIVIEGGKCPACGSRIGLIGNRIMCQHTGCSERDAAQRILEDGERRHIVKFSEDGFWIRHPLIERLEGELFECGLHLDLLSYDGPPVEPGTYRVGVELLDGALVRAFDGVVADDDPST